MSVIGSPIETSLLQAAQAQQVASKARDKDKAAQDTAARRYQDLIDLRVAGVEGAEAPRKLPSNDSEQAGLEHEAHEAARRAAQDAEGDDDAARRIDVQA